MKRIVLILGILTAVTVAGVYASWPTKARHVPEFHNGDIIFQTSKAGQSWAIQLATGSIYSHVGIIFLEEGEPMVLEAVQPVKTTSLKQFIRRGDDQHYVVKRLKDSSALDEEATKEMHAYGEKLIGLPYDLHFEWSDDKMYCSELVWKLYHHGTGLEVGELQKLGEFDLTHEVVSRIVRERYGDDIPLDEIVVSPGAIFESPLLTTVYEN